ncbi:unnamed protein product [Spirodela intermedia]|uniref:Uncharacterized protein n=1 Tax=Spirodela intermedia TaxID=51605 RepID=A0A7I8LI10_SPIIN|nr:unnamed protein product [Spirodela intermedia]
MRGTYKSIGSTSELEEWSCRAMSRRLEWLKTTHLRSTGKGMAYAGEADFAVREEPQARARVARTNTGMCAPLPFHVTND